MSRTLTSQSYTRLRRLLKIARLEAGLTQLEVATRLRRPQSFVSNYEKGESYLDVIEFTIVCKALRVSPVSILEQLIG